MVMKNSRSRLAVMALALALGLAGPLACGTKPGNAPTPNTQNTPTGHGTGDSGVDEAAVKASLEKLKAAAKKGQEFLLSKYGQPPTGEADGGWGAQFPTHGMNGLALNGLMRSIDPVMPSNEKIKATLDALVKGQEPDGAWVSGQYGQAVYETAVVLSALSAAAKLDKSLLDNADFKNAIVKGRQYLLKTQIDGTPEFEGDVVVESGTDPKYGAYYGGWGYGRKTVPDKSPANMSTTNFAMEAVVESADVVPPTGDEVAKAREKLLNFLKHNHNLAEYNGAPYNAEPLATNYAAEPEVPAKTQPANDGGAVYAPGYSKAGYDEGQGDLKMPKSYGSMTYALLRLYHMAGVAKDDPRIQAAYKWVTKAENFVFDRNPGMPADHGSHGLYYNIFTAAYALDKVAPGDVITDSKNQKHNWKQVIADQLLKLQNEAGYWQGEKKWEEHIQVLVTSYALIASGFLK